MPEDDEKKKRPMILRRISSSINEKDGAKKQKDEVLKTTVIQKEGQRPIVIKQVQPPDIKIYGAVSHGQKLKLGQRAADGIAKWGGSWWFIGTFAVFIVIWMIINFYALTHVWDPYPFILLNLVLSCLAAIQAPIILMSQNRAAERDRAKAEKDYAVNRKSEKEIQNIQDDLDHIKRRLADIMCRLPEKPRKR